MRAGTFGAVAAFALGGIMVFFIGLIYAELTTAMPRAGGEYEFSNRALGRGWSFVCTWAILLGYVGVVVFESCALPTVLQYIWPEFLKGYMYSVAGFDIYFTWLLVAISSSLLVMLINYFGTKTAAIVQTILTIAIAAIGIILTAACAVSGDAANMQPLLRNGGDGILAVTVMTPFLFLGFDVIPHAAEEANIPHRKIGIILLISIISALAFYVMVVIAVSMMMTDADIAASTLVTADAMKKAFGGNGMAANVLIIGGMAGIITSWNAFFMGGSRAIYALASEGLLPKPLANLHPKHRTPTTAILLIGLLSVIAPFFGRQMMVWITDAGSFGVTIAYMLVAVSFVRLRLKEPELKRPYAVKNWKFIGFMGIGLSAVLILLYVLPVFSSFLLWQEWVIVCLWTFIGIILMTAAKRCVK